MSNYKAVCLDLDGTLFGKDDMISLRNKETLVQCLDKGVEVYFVSGRPYFYTKYQASLVDERVRVISSNGGCYDKKDELIQKCITKEQISQIVDCLKKTNSPAFFKSKNLVYSHAAYDCRFMYDEWNLMPNFPYTKSFASLLWEEVKEEAEDIVKVLVYDMDKDVLKALRKEMEAIPGLTISCYNDISFDINADNVNKGNAIKDVMEADHIALEDLIAIGDGENDIPMFEVAGHTVAMCNAKENIQQYCDEVTTKTNKEDGVSEILEKYFM